jgi:hypothetical protein
MKRIVFGTKECWPGVKRSLDSLKKIFESIDPNINIISYNVPNCFDGSFISFLKGSNPPDLLVLGGWDNTIRNIVMNSDRSKTKIFLLWCSPLSQIDLSKEIPFFMDAVNFLQIKMIDYISVLLESDYNLLKQICNRFVYFPVYCDFSDLDKNKQEDYKGDGSISCDMFCADNSRKNVFNQIMALSPFDCRVNVNFQKPEYIESCKRYLKKPVFHGWMSREQYLKILQTVDFGMQVSFSEGFNITAAEHFYYKKPVICPNFLPFLKGKKEISEILINDISDCTEISNKVGNLIKNKQMREDFGNIGHKLVMEKNESNKGILIELFRSVLGV